MGRGRQKAKATRQAREIKYFSPETDYSALQRELATSKDSRGSSPLPERSQAPEEYSEGQDHPSEEY